MMSDIGKFFGRNVSYSKKKKIIYDKLQNDTLSPFKGRTMSDIFVYAAIFGFGRNKYEELAANDNTPQISSLAIPDSQKSTLLALVIAKTGSIDILFKPEEAIKMITEYANAGIDILEDAMLGDPTSDAITRMATEMHAKIDESLKTSNRGNF